MKLKLDLHIHSEYSHDGRMAPEEIAETAAALGLDAVAICDHDHTFQGPASINGVLVVPGIEVSTDCGHLLGLFVERDVAPERDFQRAAEAIHAAGGLTVLAHPFERSRDKERLLPLLPYLDGCEVWNGRATRKIPEANAMARAFAEEHDLLMTAGGDAHLPEEIGNGVLTVEAEERSLGALRRAIEANRGEISGREGPAVYCARSQYTKLKKTHAPLYRYGKWAAFALKCWVEDRKNGRK